MHTKYLEGHALSLFRTVCKAATDFLSTPAGMSLSRWTHVKLGFKDTDILRHASVAQRCCQFLGTRVSNSAFIGLPSLSRGEINIFELMYGLHGWLRQLHIHAAYYRWYDAIRSACDGSDRAMKLLFESAKSPDSLEHRKMELSTVDRIAHELLVHPEMSGAVTTKQIRAMLRYKAGIKDLSNLSNRIHEAVDMLIKECILEGVQRDIGDSDAEDDNLPTPAEDDNPPTPAVLRMLSMRRPPTHMSKTKQRGRRCSTIQKRSWAAVEAIGASTVKRLLLSSANFD